MTKKQKKMLARIVLAAVLALLPGLLRAEGWLRLVLYLIPYGIVGYDILLKACRNIAHGQIFDENFLMAIATVGAILLGEYAEGVAVMLFYQIGELFQSYAVGKSRRSISDLMDIRPDSANVEQNGELVQVHPADVPIGTILVVRPGERIPIDAQITEGETTLNMSALTGESLPREAGVGDTVLSGSINLSGLIHIRTTKEFGESTASKILDLVENASSKKARTEQFITRFARYYTPAVCLGALALAVLPPIVRLVLMGLSPDWSTWVMRALTFLVISCPCALVISIPLGFFAGIGGAGKEGILIKGSNYLEALAKTDCVVFDKTGTLTKGVFEVTGVYPTDLSRDLLLEYAALSEMHSTHPIGKSLRSACKARLDAARVGDVAEFSGNGVVASVDGKTVAVGNGKLMERLCVSFQESRAAGTAVYVAIDGAYAGHIVIADVVKPNAREALSDLKKAGVSRLVMLTGDAQNVARQVAGELPISEVYAGLLPQDKVSKVEALLAQKRQNTTLAFVGDGINDAPVLSRADIGIAMGALGSDAAIEAADIVLMDDDPAKIARAMRIARKCMRILYENIVFAIGIKVVCLALGAFGIANMWVAIFADVGVMVLAVCNAIRALYP